MHNRARSRDFFHEAFEMSPHTSLLVFLFCLIMTFVLVRWFRERLQRAYGRSFWTDRKFEGHRSVINLSHLTIFCAVLGWTLLLGGDSQNRQCGCSCCSRT